VALGWMWIVASYALIGGVAGALFDSLLGATVQSRRWCDTCQRETEHIVHQCGTATKNVRGFQWMDNDMVNFLSSAAGGLIAAILSR